MAFRLSQSSRRFWYTVCDTDAWEWLTFAVTAVVGLAASDRVQGIYRASHLVAAAVREGQHEVGGGLTNLSYTPEFMAFAVASEAGIEDGAVWDTMLARGDFPSMTHCDAGVRNEGISVSSPEEGETTTQRWPSPLRSAYMAGRIAKYLDESVPGGKAMALVIEKEWGIPGLVNMVALSFTSESYKPLPGPFKTTWRRAVRASLNGALHAELGHALMGAEAFQVQAFSPHGLSQRAGCGG
eukprot:8604321-Pyramimonas_sp.AAC.3